MEGTISKPVRFAFQVSQENGSPFTALCSYLEFHPTRTRSDLLYFLNTSSFVHT